MLMIVMQLVAKELLPLASNDKDVFIRETTNHCLFSQLVKGTYSLSVFTSL